MNSKPLAYQCYTADTCYEFHQFLVLTICNYFTALRVFKKTTKKVIKATCTTNNTPSPKSLAQLIAPAKLLRTCLHLLWSIIESRTLKWHRQLLCTEGGLQSASHDLAGMILFAGDSTLVWKPHPTPQPEASFGELSSMSKWETQATAERALDQHPLVGMSQSGPPVSKEVFDAFCRWCHLHSSYLQAAYALPYAMKDAFAGIAKSITPFCAPHPVAELHLRPGRTLLKEFVECNMPQSTSQSSRLPLNMQCERPWLSTMHKCCDRRLRTRRKRQLFQHPTIPHLVPHRSCSHQFSFPLRGT